MSATAARRGSFPRPKGRSQQVQDDTEEVRNLRAKYSEQLNMIRELFPTWTDEDLLFALQDSLGDVENAVVRISEGQVEQFSSVKSKKQVKKESSSHHLPSAPHTSAAAPSAAPHAARGNHVGAPAGRGRGGASVRGARGGRGGFRGVGGRGGGIAPQTNGHDVKTPENIEATTAQAFAPIATPTTGTSWAAALARSGNKSQPAPAEPAAPATATVSAQDPVETAAEPAHASAPVAEAPATQATESATTTAALTSAADESAPAVKVPAPSRPAPKAGAMSWAQIARKSEAPKPAAAVPAATVSTDSAHVEPGSGTAAAGPISTDAGASDSSTQAQHESAEQAAPAAEEPVVEAAVPEVQTDVVTQGKETAPGFAAPAVASTQSAPVEESTPAVPAGDANVAVAPPGLPKAAPRVGAQRSSQRARQDAPVVMAGGSSQLEKLGVQFGSLNFLGEDADEVPENTNEAPSQTETAPVAAQNTTAASSAHRQESQPDSFSQQPATTQYNGFKPESFDNSYGFTGQQTAPQQQQQQQAPQEQIHGYNGYSSIGQNQGTSQPQPQSQPQHGLQDYSSMYGGLDTQRLAQFYGAYDQSTNAFGQRSDDKAQPPASQQGQQQASSQQSAEHQSQQPHQHQGHQAGPGLHQQQAPQQQFPGIMPYYYPHYYMPNQFQHYAQPTAGYGQYPVYGQPAGQPQHPSKPGTPANIASPYSQAPQSDANAYGAQSHYGQNPSSAGLSSYDQGFGRGGMPGLGGMSDYSKIYGGAIPGLGGFLGSGAGAAPPSQTAASGNASSGNTGTPHMGSQQKSGTSSGSALDSYRQFDANASKGSNQSGSTSSQVGRGQGQPQGVPQQHQQPQQQQQAQQQQQQQQQYYQQYGAYGHQASSNAYSNYPYARQYWGQ